MIVSWICLYLGAYVGSWLCIIATDDTFMIHLPLEKCDKCLVYDFGFSFYLPSVKCHKNKKFN